MYEFLIFCKFQKTVNSEERQFFLQVSDLFSRKNIWDLTKQLLLVQKHWKSKNRVIFHKIRHKSRDIWRKYTIFWFFANFKKTENSEERQFFWQVSDLLSRKNTGDLTKQLLFVQKHWKSNNRVIFHKIRLKSRDIWCKCTISWFFCKF